MSKFRGLTRTKAQLSSANAWQLAQAGLQRYKGDRAGLLRNFNHGEQDTGFHNQVALPAFPMLGHGNVLWLFKKLSDVSTDSFVRTEVGSGTQLALQDEMGGVAKFITGSSDNDEQQYVAIAGNMQIPTEGVISFISEFRIDEPVHCDMFFGFCERGVDLFDGRQNSVGFYSTDGDAGLDIESNIGGDARVEYDAATITAGTWHKVEVGIQCDAEWPRRGINFFFDGQHLFTFTSKIPTAAMALSFALRNGEAAANGMSVTSAFLLRD